MKNGKPRGPVPSLIGSTMGSPRRVTVEKKSECKRCKYAILKGQKCVAIPQLGGAFQNLKRYCEECFKAILQKTEEDIKGLKNL